MQKPDWNVWRVKHKAKLAHLVLLSLNIEPNDYNAPHFRSGIQICPQPSILSRPIPAIVVTQCRVRLQLLVIALCSGSIPFRMTFQRGHQPAPYEDEERLDRFAAWCEFEELVIPPELAAIGQSLGVAERLQKEKAEAKRLAHIGWHDSCLAAAKFFSLNSVTPCRAAMLLCRFNPLDYEGDQPKYKDNPLNTTTDETTPYDYGLLLLIFEDEHKTNPQARTLRQWHDIAHTKQLTHHSWICRYIEAIGAGETSANSNAAKAAPAETEPRSDADTSTQIESSPATKPGLTRSQILAHSWPLSNPKFPAVSFAAALSKNIPNWLVAARTMKGKPGRNGAATWNPAIIAVALIGKNYASKNAMEKFFTSNLSDWLDEWNHGKENL